MTEKELEEKFSIKISVFEDDLYPDEAFFIPALKTMFISDKIAADERLKVTLHELGHKDHLPHLYDRLREKYELAANRTMIHHLIKDELQHYDDQKDFNYLVFMKKHHLTTVADEIMVISEYEKLMKKN